MIRIKTMLCLLVVTISTGIVFGFSGGDGSITNPYQISTKEDLEAVNIDLSAHYIMVNDVDLVGEATYSTAVIAPDIDYENSATYDGEMFSGSFNGNGFKIIGLTINDKGTGSDYVGLFGYIGPEAEIHNVIIENCYVGLGEYHNASLAGCNSGTINNCHSTGTIRGYYNAAGLIGINNNGTVTQCSFAGEIISSRSAGGIVGSNYQGGNIVQCYSTGTISGKGNVGGLVNINYSDSTIVECFSSATVICLGSLAGGLAGSNSGAISKCFATGDVEGANNSGGLVGSNDGNIDDCYSIGTIEGYDGVGGLIGYNSGNISSSYASGTVNGIYSDIGGLTGGQYRGTHAYCYFYIDSGPINGFGTPLDDDQLQDKLNFAGFDFIDDTSDGIEDIWTIDAGYMPRLAWQEGPGFKAPYRLADISTNLVGTGSADDPFIISTLTDLLEFRNNSALRIGYYSLVNDIDLIGMTFTESFIPEYFLGNFSGNSHIVNHLTIDGLNNLGFFRKLGGSVDHLGLENVTISGSSGNYTAALVGESFHGNVSNCYSTGEIIGDEFVAGLVGYNNEGSVSNSYSTASVEGSSVIGGLVGSNSGSIDNSFSLGIVIGSDRAVGGLAGANNSSSIITRSHSTADVTGESDTGGLVGLNSGYIESSYATGAVSGEETVGGLVGKNYFDEAIITRCYATGSVTGYDENIGGLVGDNHVGNISMSFATGSVGSTYGFVGGLVGKNYKGNISKNYATGTVSGTNSVGGLVGNSSGGLISENYATGVVNGSSAVGGLVGYSSDSVSDCYFYINAGLNNGFGVPLDDEQLQNENYFIGFDFSENSWTINLGHMPRLSWQDSPGFTAPHSLDQIITTLTGTGYSDDPFIISDVNDLVEFRNNTALRIGFYSLENDIDLAGETFPNAFIPEYFQGCFFGNRHVISNLCIIGPGLDCLGFFGKLNGFVDGLGLKDAYVHGYKPIGSLAGLNYHGFISNSYATGEIGGNDELGGLVGKNLEGSISKSFSSVFVNGYLSTSHDVGGLVGYNQGNITNCYSTGDVKGNSSVGGLVGDNILEINDCYATGDVSGHSSLGGLVGETYYSSNFPINRITNSFATGTVTGDGSRVGGLVGKFVPGSRIINCYSTGRASGDEGLSGLIGKSSYDTGSATNSFWDVNTSGTGYSGINKYGAIGKTTAEMQTQSTFTNAGWDFSDTDGDTADWWMPIGGYPKLDWKPKIAYTGQTEISLGLGESDFIELNIFSLVDGKLNWTLNDDQPSSWITGYDPNSGSTMGPDDVNSVSIAVNALDLPVGNYSSQLLLEPDIGNSLCIPISLHIFNRVDIEELALLAQFWLTTDCEPNQPCSTVDWYIDGSIDLHDLSQLATFWNGQEMIYIEAPVEPDLIQDGFETQDFSALDWQFSGQANWVIDSPIAFESSFSAKSGAIGDSQQSEMYLQVDTTGMDTISFARKVSSETNYDYLRFYIDDTIQSSWSGSLNWEIQAYPITDGEHTFKWAYTKDYSVSSGSDCGWIDNIQIYKAEY